MAPLRPAKLTETEPKWLRPPPAARSSSGATGPINTQQRHKPKARCGSGTVVWLNLSLKNFIIS